MSLTTPVAFIIFNRPDLTQVVFNAIREAKPKQLFVIADGWRSPEEEEKCQKTRAIIKQVDWDCEVFENYSEVNLGCKLRILSGIDWVFSHVEEAIILEDDCVPVSSFFNFCQTLLEYYRYDSRIMMISGDNLPSLEPYIEHSYVFSKYCFIWGWATWKRAWQMCDTTFKHIDEKALDKILDAMCNEQLEKDFRIQRYQQVKSGILNAWAAQWLYTCWGQNGLTILPKCNLVSNIGFGENATHTQIISDVANLPTKDMDIKKIIHPNLVYRDIDLEKYLFDHWFGGINLRKQKRLDQKMKRIVKKVLKNILTSISY